ncbi:Pantoate-beta-alanine ligase [Calocera viscosa TUFC12733]|uniref:Pantoate--beta-alanine ligase n=1 Tax=Calocera viscosa (strain TUFC12733) TaxID=1330018 RepID=A0A167HX90_CALVF|nr:Pantoate-beta-alanine ligase [Calocera viscosa TUFC12733]
MRAWRALARAQGKTVGFVPTMGALHDGHISLVRRSLQENDHTILSIFVNPTQFAPHEDLASYPRTLAGDLKLLTSISLPTPDAAHTEPPSSLPPSSADRAAPSPPRSVSAIFLPSVNTMYPSGVSQVQAQQRGTFVEVAGFSHQMEGRTRPTFFRGVATVCTKLFNAVEPDRAYFGQKDLQQALLLRRMCRDLLLSHPAPERLHIVPTARAADGLALSSRNAYLSPAERGYATTLQQALRAAQSVWLSSLGREASLSHARALVEDARVRASEAGVTLKLDYVEMNDPESFDVVPEETTPGDGRPVILSGALWVGRTRLIDNLILGDERSIVC